MKKLLSLLTAAATISTATVSTVACITPQYAEGPEGQRVVIVTDGGNIRDKSFNESAWDGVLQFGGQISNNVKLDAETLAELGITEGSNEHKEIMHKFNYGTTAPIWDMDKTSPNYTDNLIAGLSESKKTNRSYVEVTGKGRNAFYSGYRMAQYKKADAVLLAGFGHMDTINEVIKLMEGKTIVLLDADVPYQDAKGNKINQNVISVKFKSELAGFAAAWDSIMWASTPEVDKDGKMIMQNNKPKLRGDASGNGQISIGGFGGLSMKYAVDNYLWGMLLAINTFNKIYGDATVKTDFGENYKVNKVVFANKGGTELPKDLTIGNTDPSWFSNSFGIGDATKSGVLGTLVNNNQADIVFPIAGPQINDVISYQASYQPYLIGVDTDQIVTVGKDTASAGGLRRFATSAIKGIAQAAMDELAAAKSLRKATIEVNGKTITAKAEAPEKDHEGTIVTPKAAWSVSTSRKEAEGKWEAGKNKAIEAINYENGTGVEVKDIIVKHYEETGEGIKDYLNTDVINKATDELVTKIKSGSGSLTENGIYDFEKYINEYNARENGETHGEGGNIPPVEESKPNLQNLKDYVESIKGFVTDDETFNAALAAANAAIEVNTELLDKTLLTTLKVAYDALNVEKGGSK